MRTLFTTIKEIRDYVTVDISADFGTINPYLIEAHKFVLKGLDSVTFTSLLDYVETAEFDDADLDELLTYTRRTLANFAYAIATKRLGIYIGENGIMEFSNTNLDPISDEKLNSIKSEFFSSGYNALEMQILYIQDNKTTFADAYAFLFDNTFFVSTAKEMNDLIFTDVYNRDFFDMRSNMYLIELKIKGITGDTVFAALKAVQDDEPDEEQTAMLNYIKPAEACLAYAAKFDSEEHKLNGNNLLEQLRIYVSSLSDTDIERWDNEDKTIFVFK